jgi:NAD dependent epimerase/dehydratase family enzyme
VLRGRWCNIIVLNAHAPTEEEDDDLKDSFYEELEERFDHFPKYHIKIMLGDFNKKVLSTRQLVMGVYIRIVMIMVLE